MKTFYYARAARLSIVLSLASIPALGSSFDTQIGNSTAAYNIDCLDRSAIDKLRENFFSQSSGQRLTSCDISVRYSDLWADVADTPYSELELNDTEFRLRATRIKESVIGRLFDNRSLNHDGVYMAEKYRQQTATERAISLPTLKDYTSIANE